MLNYLKRQPLLGLTLAIAGFLTCGIADSQTPAAPQKSETEHKVPHEGVLVAGHGSNAFEGILMDIFDMLGERGVQIANRGLQKVDEQRVIGFTPLPELLDMVPEIGATSLLYIKVTPGMTYRAATVNFQCFDPSGHILWEEKANDVLVDGGNTIFHPNGWKKKLAQHIGGPGLAIKRGTAPVT